MKHLGIYCLLFALCIAFLVSCECKHEYTEASCTELKTCTLCGETQGIVLGHIESEWQNDESTFDVKNLTIDTNKCCTVCDEILETKTIELISLHDEYSFIFSPLEFTNRLEYILSELNLIQYSTEAVLDSPYTCRIIDNSQTGYLATINRMGVNFKNEENFIKDQNERGIIEISNMLFGSQYESLFPLISAIIITCDPSLDYETTVDLVESIPIYYSERVSMQKGIAYTGIGDSYTYNGIGYCVYQITPGDYEFIITVSKE